MWIITSFCSPNRPFFTLFLYTRNILTLDKNMHLIHLKLAFCSESASAVECSVLAFASNARLSFVYNKNSNHQHVCFCKSNLQEPTLHEKKPAFDCLFIVLVVTGFFTQPLYLTIFILTIHRWKRPLPETKHIVSIQLIQKMRSSCFLPTSISAHLRSKWKYAITQNYS